MSTMRPNPTPKEYKTALCEKAIDKIISEMNAVSGCDAGRWLVIQEGAQQHFAYWLQGIERVDKK